MAISGCRCSSILPLERRSKAGRSRPHLAGQPRACRRARWHLGLHQLGRGAAKKGPPLGLIIGGAVALLAIVGVVLFFVFSGGSSALSKSVPADTQIFFEVADVRGALADAMGMEAVNTKELDAEKKVKEVADGLKDAFGIKKDDAEAVLEGLQSLGMAVRNVRKDDRAAALIAFDDADGIEALLKSDRFEKDGEVSGGTRYLLKRVEEDDYEVIKEWSAPRKAFSFMSYDEDSKKVLVWFGDAKILAVGDKSMVEDIGGVLAGNDESLADSEKWGQVELEGGAAIVFVDSELISKNDDEDFEDIAKGYFRDIAPIVGAINFIDAGMVMSAHGELKGNKINEEDAIPGASGLGYLREAAGGDGCLLGLFDEAGRGRQGCQEAHAETHEEREREVSGTVRGGSRPDERQGRRQP